MFDVWFFIDYTGVGWKLAMHGLKVSDTYVNNLTPGVEKTVTVVMPHGVWTREQAEAFAATL